MSKKIKIIDLYNLIANEDNLPQRIVFRGTIYNWDSGRYLHYEDKISNEESFLEGICTEMVLNDYVEILNDELLEDNTEEIEELLTIEDYECDKTDIRLNRNKINELVKAINQIRKEKE